MKNLKKVNTIHKIILNFILSLALCFGMFSFSSTTVSAADSEHDHSTFTAWLKDDELPSSSGSYYLTTDVTLSSSWSLKNDTVLCLNGHTITYSGTSYESVITITSGVTLTIYDCDGKGTITGGTGYLSGNTTYGGGIANYGTLYMYGGTITDNSVTNRGGGIYNCGTAYLSNVTITNNTANIYAGGIYNSQNCTCSIYNCVISNNHADVGGGIAGPGALTLSNSTIESNTSSGKGGGIDSGGNLTISNSTIKSNTSSGSGGGIRCSGTVTISDCVIESNVSSSSGGGIYNSNEGTLTVSGSTIDSNVSSNNGGGVYNSNEGTLTVSDSIFKLNTSSSNGGGIYNTYGGVLKVSDTSIKSNSSSTYGGGIYLDGGMTISGSIKIQDNTCSSSANNVYIPVSYYDSQNQTYVYDNKITIDTLLSDSNIGISMQTVYNNIDVITKSSLIFSNGGSSYVDCFFIDDANYALATDNNDLKLVQNATWTWNNDYTEATAAYTIADTTYSDTTTDIISTQISQISCLQDGITSHAATIKVVKNSNTYIYTNTTNQIISATGHDYEVTFQWNNDGSACKVSYVCKNDASHTGNIDAKITSEVKTEATCYDKGTTTYIATVTLDDGQTYTDTLDVEDISVTGHVYDDPIFIWSSDGTTCAVMAVCQSDNTHVYIFDSADIAITSEVTTAATCTTNGTTTYTATVTLNGVEYTDTLDVEDITATGHTLQHVEAVAATATKDGNKEYWYCKECGKYFSDANGTNEVKYADVVIKATGTTTSNNPKTSDNVSYMIYVVGIALSGLYIAKRRKYND